MPLPFSGPWIRSCMYIGIYCTQVIREGMTPQCTCQLWSDWALSMNTCTMYFWKSQGPHEHHKPNIWRHTLSLPSHQKYIRTYVHIHVVTSELGNHQTPLTMMSSTPGQNFLNLLIVSGKICNFKTLARVKISQNVDSTYMYAHVNVVHIHLTVEHCQTLCVITCTCTCTCKYMCTFTG